MSGRKGVECGKLHNLPPCTAKLLLLLLHSAKMSSFAISARCTIRLKNTFNRQTVRWKFRGHTSELWKHFHLFWTIEKYERPIAWAIHQGKCSMSSLKLTHPAWPRRVWSKTWLARNSPSYLLPSGILATFCQKLWQADYWTNFLAATFSPKMGKLPHSISSGSQYTWVWYHPPPFYTRSANPFLWWSSVSVLKIGMGIWIWSPPVTLNGRVRTWTTCTMLTRVATLLSGSGLRSWSQS